MPYKNIEDARAGGRRYYRANKEKRRQYNILRQARMRNYIWRVKRYIGCTDCSESDPCCLDFHHINRDSKKFYIAHALGVSMKKIKNEMRKCIVVCANCHRKRHHKDRKKEPIS